MDYLKRQFMSKEYRRRPKSDVWHFMANCRWYPPLGVLGGQKKATIVQHSKPKSGELCNECLAKTKRKVR